VHEPFSLQQQNDRKKKSSCLGPAIYLTSTGFHLEVVKAWDLKENIRKLISNQRLP